MESKVAPKKSQRFDNKHDNAGDVNKVPGERKTSWEAALQTAGVCEIVELTRMLMKSFPIFFFKSVLYQFEDVIRSQNLSSAFGYFFVPSFVHDNTDKILIVLKQADQF